MLSLFQKFHQKIKPTRFLNVVAAFEEFSHKHGARPGAFLEFGTYRGDSTLAFYRALRYYFYGAIPRDAYHFYLFDSFLGLPKSDDPRDSHINWEEKVFDVGGVEHFKKEIVRRGLPIDRFTCVPGFYKESLSSFSLPPGTKAAIVNIDCDYYSSTKLALNFLKPYLQNFTLIHFDDVHAFAGNPYKGQVAAINEFNHENHNINIQPCPYFYGFYKGKMYWSCIDED